MKELEDLRRGAEKEQNIDLIIKERKQIIDELEARLAGLDKERRDLEKVQDAMAESEDHKDEQEATARLRAKLVDEKGESQRIRMAVEKMKEEDK